VIQWNKNDIRNPPKKKKKKGKNTVGTICWNAGTIWALNVPSLSKIQPPYPLFKAYPNSASSAPIPAHAYSSLFIPRELMPNSIFRPRYLYLALFDCCSVIFSAYIHASRMRSIAITPEDKVNKCIEASWIWKEKKEEQKKRRKERIRNRTEGSFPVLAYSSSHNSSDA
jgi:hypothetical protein